jgi:hypothetical protein
MTAVTVHVYDLGRGQLKAVGSHWAGLFHSGVEIYGREYSFGMTAAGQSGVFENAPRGCTMHTYKESISMGRSVLGADAVAALLGRLREEWTGDRYDLLHRVRPPAATTLYARCSWIVDSRLLAAPRTVATLSMRCAAASAWVGYPPGSIARPTPARRSYIWPRGLERLPSGSMRPSG